MQAAMLMLHRRACLLQSAPLLNSLINSTVHLADECRRCAGAKLHIGRVILPLDNRRRDHIPTAGTAALIASHSAPAGDICACACRQ
jgi:hypothetical protein